MGEDNLVDIELSISLSIGQRSALDLLFSQIEDVLGVVVLVVNRSPRGY